MPFESTEEKAFKVLQAKERDYRAASREFNAAEAAYHKAHLYDGDDADTTQRFHAAREECRTKVAAADQAQKEARALWELAKAQAAGLLPPTPQPDVAGPAPVTPPPAATLATRKKKA